MMLFRPKASFSLALVLSLATPSAAAWTPPPEYAIYPSADGHFFQQHDGSPFFWQADTAWLLFHRLNYTEAEIYLDDRAAKGYNIVQAVGFQQIGIDDPNRNGDLTFHDEDPLQPNEAYWGYVDSIMELAWTKGIRIGFVPVWGYYIHNPRNEGGVINEKTAFAFGEFIGRRYPYMPKFLVGDTNPWWQSRPDVRDDYLDGGVKPEREVIDWSPIYKDLAYGIITGEKEMIGNSTKRRTSCDKQYKPLMSIHPTNQWFAGGPVAVASAFFPDEEWLTFDCSQSGHSDFPPNPPIPWWNCRRGWESVELMYAVGESTPGKKRPALDMEPHYEGRYNNGKQGQFYWNASDVRIGAWQAAFSGAAGIAYGSDNVMQIYIPELWGSAGSGPARSWAEDIHLPGASQMQYISKAVLDRGNSTYFTRIPAQSVIVGDAGHNDERVTATRDSGGSWIMVYTPTAKPFTLDTRSIDGCDVTASWYDVLTGEYTKFEYEQCGEDKAARKFSPSTSAGHPDWLLVLEAN
ncbi:hypothetical protein ACHAQA_006807 [Verticillium albo-atrum]